TLPRINYTFDYLGSVEGEGKATFERIMEEIGSIDLISSLIQLAVYGWIIYLCGVATRVITGFSSTKSLLISTASLFVSILLSYVLGV
ncbi:MAG: hypothetical protein QXJ02_04745, partial [Candidatus Bathyarchaeia archaeon]